MRSIVVLAFIAVAIVVAIFNRFAALLLYWWFAIFRPQDWIWLDVSNLRLSLVAGLILVIPCLLTGKLPRLGHVISYLMLLWLALAAAATYFNGCGAAGWEWLDHLARLMLVLFLTNRLVVSPNRLFWLCAVVACSVGFYSAKGGFYALSRGGAVQYGLEHLTGTLAGSNAFALGTVLAIFLMIATAQNALSPEGREPVNCRSTLQPWLRIFQVGMWLAVPFSVYEVISLFSRGSAVGLACGLLTLFILQKNRGQWLLGLLPLLLVASLFVPLPEGYTDRVSTIIAEPAERDASAASRPYFWSVGIAITSDHPFGVGPGCFPYYYNYYDESEGLHGRNRSVHSSHFQVLAETGYLGASIWVLLFVLSFRVLAGVRRVCGQGGLPPSLSRFLLNYANALIALMVAFAVGGSFYELAHSEFIWLAFTLAVVLERLTKEAYAEAVGATTHTASTLVRDPAR